MKIRWFCIWLVIPFIFLGCSPAPSAIDTPAAITPTNAQAPEYASQTPRSNSSDNPIVPVNTLDNSETTPPPPEANPFIKLAEEDLANRLHINSAEVRFLKITDIDWQDITQGCTPGQKLTKGRLSGYRIWLEANSKNYVYHIGLDNTIYLCPD